MLWFRSVVFTLIMIVTVPFYAIPGMIILLIMPFHVRYHYYRGWATFMIWLLDVICNLKYEVQGTENIPDGAAIIFSKHQSTWETFALQKIFPPQVWVIKQELAKVPFFGWALVSMGAVAIDRKSGRKAIDQIVEQGTDRLNKGRWIVIFPEGTRVVPGKRKKYGIGGAMLAEKSGYPVVPVSHNAGEYWPRHSLIKKPGVIQIRIGPTIASDGPSAEEIRDQAEDWIENTYKEISTLYK